MSQRRSPLVALVIIGVAAVALPGCGGGSDSKSSASGSGITGFSATDAAWNAHHKEDSQFEAGSSYDRDSSLARGGDSQHIDRYYAVSHEGGTVTSYEMRFPPGTDIQSAKRLVLKSEFPSDAKIVWFKHRNTCAQMLVRSAKVSRAMQDADPRDRNAAALVEFSSGEAGDQYDSGDVWDAIVMLASGSGGGIAC